MTKCDIAYMVGTDLRNETITVESVCPVGHHGWVFVVSPTVVRFMPSQALVTLEMEDLDPPLEDAELTQGDLDEALVTMNRMEKEN